MTLDVGHASSGVEGGDGCDGGDVAGVGDGAGDCGTAIVYSGIVTTPGFGGVSEVSRPRTSEAFSLFGRQFCSIETRLEAGSMTSGVKGPLATMRNLRTALVVESVGPTTTEICSGPRPRLVELHLLGRGLGL